MDKSTAVKIAMGAKIKTGELIELLRAGEMDDAHTICGDIEDMLRVIREGI
jgi:hypothetical protein